MNILLSFLKKHYEKLILGVLLLVFIGLLIFLAFLVRETKKIKAASGTSTIYTDDAKSKKIAEKPEYVIGDSLKFSLWNKKGMDIAGSKNDGKKTASAENKKEADNEANYFEDFVMPIPLTICPECRKAIPEADFKFPHAIGNKNNNTCLRNISHEMAI